MKPWIYASKHQNRFEVLMLWPALLRIMVSSFDMLSCLIIVQEKVGLVYPNLNDLPSLFAVSTIKMRKSFHALVLPDVYLIFFI